MKTIYIEWSKQDHEYDETTKALVEQIVNAWEDFNYGYDIEDDGIITIHETLTELGINCEIIDIDD